MAAKSKKLISVEKIWLTVEELTQYLGFANAAKQREWREHGLLPFYKIDRMILYNKMEVDDFVRKYKQVLLN